MKLEDLARTITDIWYQTLRSIKNFVLAICGVRQCIVEGCEDYVQVPDFKTDPMCQCHLEKLANIHPAGERRYTRHSGESI